MVMVCTPADRSSASERCKGLELADFAQPQEMQMKVR